MQVLDYREHLAGKEPTACTACCPRLLQSENHKQGAEQRIQSQLQAIVLVLGHAGWGAHSWTSALRALRVLV